TQATILCSLPTYPPPANTPSQTRPSETAVSTPTQPSETAVSTPTRPAETAVSTPTPSPTTSPSAALSIKVVGNQFVDQNGQTVRLLGVNRSGTQYTCYEGNGFFDGPADDTSIQAMKSWGITAVRVNLNEHCWLGLSDVPKGYGGEAYHQAIGAFVTRLNAHGLYVIVDMHHSGPGLTSASRQQPMADRDHAVAYWSSVASFFKDNPAVLFDLFNEPYPDNNQSTTTAWTCVRDGGSCPGVGFVAEGMQPMLDAVRAAGATNPVIIGGPQYAGTLDRWLEFKPNDPLNQLAASVHIYGQPLGSPYADPSRWDAEIAPVAQQVPVVIGEMGDADCTHRFVDRLMAWGDGDGISYLGWSWFVGGWANEPSLIPDYRGTPSQYGIGVGDHLLSLLTTDHRR